MNEYTLLLPADTSLPTIHGKWQRGRDGVEARYTAQELRLAMWLAEIWEPPKQEGLWEKR